MTPTQMEDNQGKACLAPPLPQKNTRNGNPSLDEVSPGFVGGGYTRVW